MFASSISTGSGALVPQPHFALLRRLFGGRAPVAAAQGQPASQEAGPTLPQPLGFANVLFLGDSITQGQHTDDFTYDYFWQVIVRLREQSPSNAKYYLVDGVGGATVAEFLAHLKAFSLRPANAQLIVVELGTNDYLQNVPLATIQQNYACL
ncbi:MAG: SGNH/GDSL hydrolase family protein, partial [Ktedonobacterales bacterium]